MDDSRNNARNGILIYGGCYDNSISNNIIGGNLSDGIHIMGDHARAASAHGNQITKNLIGVTQDLEPVQPNGQDRLAQSSVAVPHCPESPLQRCAPCCDAWCCG